MTCPTCVVSNCPETVEVTVNQITNNLYLDSAEVAFTRRYLTGAEALAEIASLGYIALSPPPASAADVQLFINGVAQGDDTSDTDQKNFSVSGTELTLLFTPNNDDALQIRYLGITS